MRGDLGGDVFRAGLSRGLSRRTWLVLEVPGYPPPIVLELHPDRSEILGPLRWSFPPDVPMERADGETVLVPQDGELELELGGLEGTGVDLVVVRHDGAGILSVSPRVALRRIEP